MYNRNYSKFDYPSTSSGQAQANPLGISYAEPKGLLTSVLKRKSLTLIPKLTVIQYRCNAFK